MVWWNELSGLQQLFASIAIPATLVMVIQFILLLFGFSNGDGTDGADAQVDADLQDGFSHDILEDSSSDTFDGNPHDEILHHSGDGHENVDALRLFTLRSMIAFLSVGGWMGVAALSWKVPVPLAFVLAFCAGTLALTFVAWSIRAALRLQQSGNVIPENAIGKIGEVYIPIPASKGGFGKVNIIVQDRLCELEAVSNSERILKTGESVTVMGVSKEGMLIVVPTINPQEGVVINKN